MRYARSATTSDGGWKKMKSNFRWKSIVCVHRIHRHSCFRVIQSSHRCVLSEVRMNIRQKLPVGQLRYSAQVFKLQASDRWIVYTGMTSRMYRTTCPTSRQFSSQSTSPTRRPAVRENYATAAGFPGLILGWTKILCNEGPVLASAVIENFHV